MRPAKSSMEWSQVTEWNEGVVRTVQDALTAEEPLEIRVDGAPLTVTMRTPGHDVELAAGFLFTEGIIQSRDQIAEIRAALPDNHTNSNLVDVRLKDTDFEAGALQRNFFAASSCGICGKASIEAIRRRDLRPLERDFRIEPELLCRMPEELRAEQALFNRTGGLHAAALFDATGALVVLREDIGRHNAVDKVIGWALNMGRWPLSRHVMMVSGRGGFEIVQKALTASIPVVASVSAPSALAVKLARQFGLTLLGFMRGQRFVVYSGGFRCLPQMVKDVVTLPE
jgi:FdhD protein